VDGSLVALLALIGNSTGMEEKELGMDSWKTASPEASLSSRSISCPLIDETTSEVEESSSKPGLECFTRRFTISFVAGGSSSKESVCELSDTAEDVSSATLENSMLDAC